MKSKNMNRTFVLRFPVLAAIYLAAASITVAANAEANGNGAKKLGYTKVLKGVNDLETAKKKVTAALKKQGFGVVTEIDVTATPISSSS